MLGQNSCGQSESHYLWERHTNALAKVGPSGDRMAIHLSGSSIRYQMWKMTHRKQMW